MAGKAPLLLAGVLYFIGMIGLTVTSIDEVRLHAFQQRPDVYPSDETRVSVPRAPREVPAFDVEGPADASAPEAVQPEDTSRLFAFASSTAPTAAVQQPAPAPEASAPPAAPPVTPAPAAPAPLPTENPNANAAAVDPPGDGGGTTPLPPPGSTPETPPPAPPPAQPPPSDGGAVEPPPTEPEPAKSVGKAVANDRARERASESSAVFSSTSQALKKAATLQALPPGQVGKADK